MLALELAAEGHVISRRKGDLGVDHGPGLLDESADVPPFDVAQDDLPSEEVLPEDRLRPLVPPDLREIRKGDALASGGIDEQAPDGFLVLPVALGQPDQDGRDAIGLVDVGGLDAVERRFDEVGDLADGDAVEGHPAPVEPQDELRDPRGLLDLEVGHAPDVLQGAADLLDLLVQDIEVEAEQLHGELAFRSGQHLRQLVGDGLFEEHGQPGKDLEPLAHVLR